MTKAMNMRPQQGGARPQRGERRTNADGSISEFRIWGTSSGTKAGWMPVKPAPAAAASAPDPAANTAEGTYGGILNSLNAQASAAKAQQDYWANKAVEDSKAQAAMAASMEAEKAASAAALKQQQDALQQMMIQQQSAFAQQQQLQQQQIAASNAAYEEQKRSAEALSRAYVPNQEATALSPIVGDQRSAFTASGSSKNTLSSLSILTGLDPAKSTGSMGSLSGLQIA